MQGYSITQALSLPEYKITEVKDDLVRLRIYVEPYKRKPFICSKCDVTVDDLTIFHKRVRLIVTKGRMRCPQDGKLHVEHIDWVKPRARVTNRLAQDVYRLTSITTNTEAGWYLGFDDEKIYRIDLEILEGLAARILQPTPTCKNMSVDEVAWRKYYQYLTNVIDVDIRKVIWNEKGRTAEVLDKYYGNIGKDNSGKIESVALDGAMPYISSTAKNAPNALIVYDKFHVVQRLNTTVDTVRKLELRKARKEERSDLIEMMDCKQRFILLKNKGNLTGNQKERLDRLCSLNESIYK
ncbi:MAG: transposase, partial [Candidatus Omnitrophica bacterium]|nr:transposase [Candidatus Omnitrophota bacterium]